jgi:hypothetical protein
MRNKLLLVADLGCLKVFRVEYDVASSNPKMELVESFETIDSHGRLGDLLTDEAGRKGNGGLLGNVQSYGEKHNMALELQKRSIKGLARSINEVVKGEKEIQDCYFAASREIHHQIMAELEPAVRNRIVKKISDDLIHVEKSDLLKHFSSPAL